MTARTLIALEFLFASIFYSMQAGILQAHSNRPTIGCEREVPPITSRIARESRREFGRAFTTPRFARFMKINIFSTMANLLVKWQLVFYFIDPRDHIQRFIG